jgi:predicted amidohydrolase
LCGRHIPWRVLGVVPKTYLPNYREFYEKRQFTSGAKAVARTIGLFGDTVPFGNDIIFQASNYPDFTLHIEICEDVWVPLPPSTLAAMAGATVLANLSASNSIVAKADYRRLLCSSQSAKCIAAYLYCQAKLPSLLTMHGETRITALGLKSLPRTRETHTTSTRFAAGSRYFSSDSFSSASSNVQRCPTGLR